MAEGHIELTLSLFVCVYVCVCVWNRVWPKTWSCMVGFDDNLAQNLITIMTRQCVSIKNDVTRSKGKVTVRTSTWCKSFNETCSCPTHNFVMQAGIYKSFGRNDYYDKMMCQEQKPCH